jgi:hypothetical protein
MKPERSDISGSRWKRSLRSCCIGEYADRRGVPRPRAGCPCYETRMPIELSEDLVDDAANGNAAALSAVLCA